MTSGVPAPTPSTSSSTPSAVGDCPGTSCRCGARFTTCGAQFQGGPYATCPLCGASLGGKGLEVPVPLPEALGALRKAYREACSDLAGQLAFDLRGRGLTGDWAWDHAQETVKRFHDPAATPHAWIFWTRLPLALSQHADDALDERTDGRFDWDVPDPQSAARAVAEHDVLTALGAILDMGDG